MLKEPSPLNPTTPELRGRLLRQVGVCSLTDTVSQPQYADRERTTISSLGIAELEGTVSRYDTIFDGKTTLLQDADVSGLWHYSVNDIKEFSEATAQKSDGKFGRGTYFGVGDLKGETVDGLRSDSIHKYSASFRGTIAVVQRDHVLAVAADLRLAQYVSSPGFKTNIQNAPLTDLFSMYAYTTSIDAVLVVMDEAGAAELVVSPAATNQISIE